MNPIENIVSLMIVLENMRNQYYETYKDEGVLNAGIHGDYPAGLVFPRITELRAEKEYLSILKEISESKDEELKKLLNI